MRFLVAAVVVMLVTAIGASADSSNQSQYVDAVQRAYDAISDAAPPDTAAADSAVQILVAGTGTTQPEILDDLRARPPLYGDARDRLSTLLVSLRDPLATADPAAAKQRAHDVLAMSRYDALRRPPNPVERFVQWLEDRVNDLLQLVFGRAAGAQPPDFVFYAIGIAIVAAVAFVVVRASRGRFGRGAVNLAPHGPRPPADYFADADRLAAAGDRVGAIRALCAAVAGTLAGERSWEGSALTVREIFSRAADAPTLRPLLLPFEAAVYGGRDVDVATYERAAQVAARFRVPAAVAA